MAEDVYEGYYIPQGILSHDSFYCRMMTTVTAPGSTVVGNVWAIFHDTTEYPDPFAFRPERFLKAPGKKMPRDPAAAAFGFGRRYVTVILGLESYLYFLAFAQVVTWV